MDAEISRVALLTGASSGIGFAVASRLAERKYRIVLCSRNPQSAAAALAKSSGAEVVAVAADIAEPSTAERLMEVVSKMGRLDSLLLNHGSPLALPLLDVTDEAWESHFRLMVLGPLRLLRAAVEAFRHAGGGRVVAITSGAVKAPRSGIVLSGSLRAALVNALKTAAAELGPENILCNAVAPGYTDVPATRQRWNSYYAQRTGNDIAETDRATLERIPLGRYAQPSEIAAMICFLLSEDNSYVSGQHILVDGGSELAT